jgi:flagellar biosynthetic protein FliR
MILDTTDVMLFVLALARTSAWVAASPLFSTQGLAGVGRLAFAIALALFAVPISAGAPAAPVGLFDFLLVALGQVALGLLLGWVTGLALAIFQSAGAVIDLTSGFSVSAILDPATGAQSAVMARVFGLAFTALFFATGAHLMVVGGFVRSFEAVPVTQLPIFEADSVAMAATALADLLLAALEIAAPTLGALLLAEVALAFAARFAPQANIFMIGLPLKLGVALVVGGMSLVFLPTYAETVVDRIVDLGQVPL